MFGEPGKPPGTVVVASVSVWPFPLTRTLWRCVSMNSAARVCSVTKRFLCRFEFKSSICELFAPCTSVQTGHHNLLPKTRTPRPCFHLIVKLRNYKQCLHPKNLSPPKSTAAQLLCTTGDLIDKLTNVLGTNRRFEGIAPTNVFQGVCVDRISTLPLWER